MQRAHRILIGPRVHGHLIDKGRRPVSAKESEPDQTEINQTGSRSTTYHRPELQAVTQIRDGVHEEGVVILEANGQDGGKEVLCKIMQHFPLPSKFCTHTQKHERKSASTHLE